MAPQQLEDDLTVLTGYEDGTPTPAGWKRKLIPRIGKGMVAVQTDVVFIAPSGEELKSKAQLQRYLKSKKSGPSLSEFIWSVDGTPQRSTRSKSAPLFKPLEMPLRVDVKRKSGLDIKEVGSGKRRNTGGKVQKPEEDSKVSKSDHAKNADVTTPSEGEIKADDEATQPGPARSTKKGSGKGTVKKDPSPTVTKISSTKGTADISNKENKAVDTGKEPSSEKSGKKTKTKGRSVQKKGLALRGRRAGNSDVSNAGEFDGNTGSDGDHPEEATSLDGKDETI